MSRYCLRPLPQFTHIYEVAIGWDHTFASYFVAIFGPSDEHGDPALLRWIGATFGEVTDPQSAINFARKVAEVPCYIHRRLRADKRQCPPLEAPDGAIHQYLTKPTLLAVP